MSEPTRGDLSRLPSMTELLERAAGVEGLRDAARPALAEAVRAALDEVRQELRAGQAPPCGVESVLARARSRLDAERLSLRLRRVINATGIVLHTGLGRSVLPAAAVRQLVAAAAGYCNVEVFLGTGERGRRARYCEILLQRLTGAESALVVNNNAAATMLVLHGLARGREVIVSRGQLIEIGGSFRLPEVMTAGGAVLREIGTTNKTHLRDYEAAIGERTAMIMHVHTSNYRVIGFSECPTAAELAGLAHARGLPLFDDLGSGALLRNELWTAAGEPTAVESLRHGADVVAFSGDKLLGGPQAGILLGRSEIIERLRGDPMARALRVGKLTIAALEATLELYQDPERARREIPLLSAISESQESLMARAARLVDALKKGLPEGQFRVEAGESFAGGGSLPAWPMSTAVVRWRPPAGVSVNELAHRLRLGRPAVLTRVHEDEILLDLRTLRDEEFDELAPALAAAAAS
jgi:L-seryl-tRNA(Ser) seleniumtransferase